MEPNVTKPRDIVDTTDSLEAVGACRSMKNFLFIVIQIGLLLTQIMFWMNRLELVAQSSCSSCPGCKAALVQQPIEPVKETQTLQESDGLLPLAATVDVAQEVEKVTQAQENEQTAETQLEDGIILVEQSDEQEEAVIEPSPQDPSKQSLDEGKVKVESIFLISRKVAGTLVAICNFFVIIAAVLYSLTLLICLKISLIGRLGGINHIARAFFISLFLLVVLIPWQQLIPGVLVGTIWLPSELFCGGWSKTNETAIWKGLFYLRFCGLWFVALWFLFWSQSRSIKWTRATMRRQGVAR